MADSFNPALSTSHVPSALTVDAQSVDAPSAEGSAPDWFRDRLMNWCYEHRLNPAHYKDLFAIADEVRMRCAATPERSSPPADSVEVHVGVTIDRRLSDKLVDAVCRAVTRNELPFTRVSIVCPLPATSPATGERA